MNFPGESVVKNPPANALYAGLITDLGKSYMLQSNSAHVPQLLAHALEPESCDHWACVLELLKPDQPRAHVVQEMPPQGEAHALQLGSGPYSLQLEKKLTQQWRPSTAKNKNK